jgi:uncharacterized iron-regulated membrane protein
VDIAHSTVIFYLIPPSSKKSTELIFYLPTHQGNYLMTTTKNNSHYFQDIRHLHRTLAPIMLLPLLLTTITGTVYQIVDLAGKEDGFKWLLHWHKGQFGALNLEVIYPFLNAIGLFILLFTGIYMWFHMLPTSKKESTEAQINIPLAKVPK